MALACAAAVSTLGTSAAAQSAEEPRGTLRIEVTGSNLKRVDTESGLPVQVITRQEILDGGMQTVQDLMERISANQAFGGVNEALGIGSAFGTGSGIPGFTGASLRGLGVQRTLVLFNGRRIAPYALASGQGVDLSAIPTSAIERVEILKDGASAIYGSDAIGGVMNFILRTDFAGTEVNASYFGTEQGGGDNWRVSATAGVGDLAKDRYNAFMSASYYKQDALEAAARDATRTGYRPDLGMNATNGNSFPANISQAGGFGSALRNPTIPYPGGATATSCDPPQSFPTSAQPYQCRFDLYTQGDTMPAAEKVNALGRFAWQFDRDAQFFAEGSYYRGVVTQRTTPLPVQFDGAGKAYSLAPTSPYFPADFVRSLPGGKATLPVQVRFATVDVGPLVSEVTSEQWRAVAGLQGQWQEWDYALVANLTSNRQTDELVSGVLWEAPFTALFKTGQYNPFGHNTDAVVQQLRAMEATGQWWKNATASDYGGGFKATRSFGSLPGGPMGVALGIEGRQESLDLNFRDFGNSLLSWSSDHKDFDVGRTAWAFFGELNVPVTKTLEATLAVRYDHYSDFGGTTNPKVALRWQPRTDTLFRASWGTGFRAPTLADVYTPLYFWGTDIVARDDPWRCPTTRSPDDCGANFRIYTGGNPLLQPEKSTQWGAGVVVEPIAGLSVGVDYYNVEVRGIVDRLMTWMIFGDFDFWAPSYVIRKPRTAEDLAQGLPGAIDHLNSLAINYGTLKTSGIDVDLRYRSPATPAGLFTFALSGTYVIGYTREFNASDEYPASVGTTPAGWYGPVVRWRHYATLGWTRGPWGATLAQNFQDGYSQRCLSADPSGCATRRVDSYSVWDLQGRYTGFKDWTLALGVRNLLDQAPPVSGAGGTWQKGFDASYADPRGRMYYGAVRYAFK